METQSDQWFGSTPVEFPPNGAQAPAADPGHVRFGHLPNQVLPIEWAEIMLQIIYKEHPGVFRAILPRLYGLPADEPKRRRGPS